MVFGRQVEERVLTFGVSGLLRQSNLIMWDHETESLWQQGTFESIVGEFAGTRLEALPSSVVSWKEFVQAYPEGNVLSQKSFPIYEQDRLYEYNPYESYDSSYRPSLFRGDVDTRLPSLERVVGIGGPEGAIAYPFSQLAEEPVVHATIGSRSFVILYDKDTRSNLDSPDVAFGRSVGTAGVFVPNVDGLELTFVADGDRFIDRETGSTWNIFGQAVEGALNGKRLPPVFHVQSFWFYWAAANPETRIWEPT